MKEETISLRESLSKIVMEHHEKPVISAYEINWYLYELYRDKKFNGLKIGKITADEPDYRVVGDATFHLLRKGVISKCVDGVVYYINNKDKPSAQQVVCSINPCSYISYISAMEWHGITDRIPSEVHVTMSTPRYLKEYFSLKIKESFPFIKNKTFLIPQLVSSIPIYDGKKIIFHKKTDFKIKNEQFASGGIRVTNIGETFLDMLKFPEYCGGFNHVISVFEGFAEKYLPIIVKEFSKNGNSMDKARAGYILEDICGLTHKGIDSWADSVQRGGSRKLIASEPYSNVFSERWCISINM